MHGKHTFKAYTCIFRSRFKHVCITEIGAPVRSNLFNLFCSGHLIRSIAVKKRIFFLRLNFFSFMLLRYICLGCLGETKPLDTPVYS